MNSWHQQPWQPKLDWNNSSGELLSRALHVLSPLAPCTITVFGSAPLQMGLYGQARSNDLDIIDFAGAGELLNQAKLLKGQANPYIEPCSPGTFTASPDWISRAHSEEQNGFKILFPHPIDILVSKIKRMEEKDYKAFLLVREQTGGHPTESELIDSLKRVVDIYRPAFDEEATSDPLNNTRLLWQRFFGKDIDVREKIIRPALESRKASYSQTEQQLKPFKAFTKLSETPTQ